MNLIQIEGAVELGLIHGLVAIGVYITFRVIDFPDLTVDGSFPLGGAVTASMIVAGMNPWLATLVAVFCGAGAGCITGYLNLRWGILGLLAGILTMTGLYSINLRIMGRPNIPLLGAPTLFPENWNTLILLGVVVILLTAAVGYFLTTEMGLGVRATGVNPVVARAQGVSVKKMTYLMLAISNGLVALAGALFAQAEGFADITVGTGTIIVGLASVIIGEAIFQTRNVVLLVIGCVVGSIVYRIAIAFALNVGDYGLRASDLKLITALLIALTMIVPKVREKMRVRVGKEAS